MNTISFAFDINQRVKSKHLDIKGVVACLVVDRTGALGAHIEYVTGTGEVREKYFIESELESDTPFA